jgi:predicted metal-dependent HD superfamily phosphohydrolase
MSDGLCFEIDGVGIAALRRQWLGLLARYSNDEAYALTIFDSLTTEYLQAARCYHNLSHIHSLFELYDARAPQPKHDDAIRFAIWFHDAIYDTRRKDNEERSADWAAQTLQNIKAPDELIDDVRRLILATKRHEPGSVAVEEQVFLDLDLAILGSEPKIYERYAAAIRREYEWVPKFLYRRERRKILANFLNRQTIYVTTTMSRQYEQQARHNLQTEIEALSR